MSGRGKGRLNLQGQKFFRLLVHSFAHKDPRGNSYWNCICDCGNGAIVRGTRLVAGVTISCGCYKKVNRVTHGKFGSPAYSSWAAMMQRCNNPNNERYKDYGARGITICEEWLDFSNFYADMGDRPAGLSLERKDNSKGYSKDNCKWATPKEQANNRRPAKRKDVYGVTSN